MPKLSTLLARRDRLADDEQSALATFAVASRAAFRAICTREEADAEVVRAMRSAGVTILHSESTNYTAMPDGSLDVERCPHANDVDVPGEAEAEPRRFKVGDRVRVTRLGILDDDAEVNIGDVFTVEKISNHGDVFVHVPGHGSTWPLSPDQVEPVPADQPTDEAIREAAAIAAAAAEDALDKARREYREAEARDHCGWCLERLDGVEAFRTHAATCPKHPIRPLVEALREAEGILAVHQGGPISHARHRALKAVRDALEPYDAGPKPRAFRLGDRVSLVGTGRPLGEVVGLNPRGLDEALVRRIIDGKAYDACYGFDEIELDPAPEDNPAAEVVPNGQAAS